MPPHPFGKSQRVRRRSQFQQAFSAGYRVSSRYFTLIILADSAPSAATQTAQVEAWLEPAGLRPARLGIVASRKLGDAVRRNRAKRLIREMFRHLEPLPVSGPDVVVIPRRELFNAPFSDLERDFRTAWQRGVSRLRPVHAG